MLIKILSVIKQDESNTHAGLGLWCLKPLSTIFHYIVAVSFIGVGNRRKPLKITVTVKHNQIMFIEYTPLKEGFELTIFGGDIHRLHM